MVLLILILIVLVCLKLVAGYQRFVPSDLATRTAVTQAVSKQRSSSKSGLLDPADIERDPDTGLAIDGREQLMFLLSNEVMRELVTAKHTPSEEDVTTALWSRFCEEADIGIVSERGAWTINDAATKARARLHELESGAYDFVSRSDRTTLVAGAGKVGHPKLVGAIEAQSKLNTILGGFFENLAEGANPRAAIRLTMGTGKTKQTIAHLKAYLADKFQKTIEVYVPRHDLADEWAEGLEGHCQNKSPCAAGCWILASGPCPIQYRSAISKPALRSSNLRLCCM